MNLTGSTDCSSLPAIWHRRPAESCRRTGGAVSFHQYTGVVGSRWAPRSSKPVAGRAAGRGGFDSHPLPPFYDEE